MAQSDHPAPCVYCSRAPGPSRPRQPSPATEQPLQGLPGSRRPAAPGGLLCRGELPRRRCSRHAVRGRACDREQDTITAWWPSPDKTAAHRALAGRRSLPRAGGMGRHGCDPGARGCPGQGCCPGRRWAPRWDRRAARARPRASWWGACTTPSRAPRSSLPEWPGAHGRRAIARPRSARTRGRRRGE